MQSKNIGRVRDQSFVQKLIDDFWPETFDIKSGARSKMIELFAMLSRARVRRTTLDHAIADNRRAIDRTSRGHFELLFTARAKLRQNTFVICGITSPARETITVSPIFKPRRSISSALCNDACVIVTPPTFTGPSRQPASALPCGPPAL